MLKRVCFWSLSFLLLLGGPVQAVTMVSATANNIKMRSGPGEKYPVLWVLKSGYPLSIVDDQGDWVKVQDYEGDTGWLAATLVGRSPHMIVKADRVELRSGPSSRYRLVGKANHGVVFQTLKVKDKWVKVKHESGLTGWITRGSLWGW